MKLFKLIMSPFLFILAIVFLSINHVFAESSWDQVDVDPDKDWTIVFNSELDGSTINKKNIYVIDDSGLVIDGVKLYLNSDKKSIKVGAPVEGYKPLGTYFLNVEKSVKSAKGVELKNPVVMKFKVKRNPIRDLEKYEVAITYDRVELPTSWLKHPINGNVTLLEQNEVERTKEIIYKALSKYPYDVVNKNLKNIYLVKSLSFYGVQYGGTNSSTSVFIANNGYTDENIEKLFHAEFSSILLRNNKSHFNNTAWNNINPADFSYLGTGAEAIRDGTASEKLEEVNLNQGFLTQYSKSSLENDFNSFAKNIFIKDRQFWETVDRYPLIYEKLKLTVDFYHSLDPIFTENYFTSMSY